MSPEIVSQLGVVRGVIAAVLLVAFIALWFWAYSSRRRAMFDSAAQLPLEDDTYGVQPARGEVK